MAVPGDPALLSTAGAVAAEHASGEVYILPAVLLAVAGGMVAAVIAVHPPAGTR